MPTADMCFGGCFDRGLVVHYVWQLAMYTLLDRYLAQWGVVTFLDTQWRPLSASSFPYQGLPWAGRALDVC